MADRGTAGAAVDVPGERTSPTQPFPTKPPPFDRQGVTIDDLIDFTPELRAEAIEIVKQYVIGPLFTPPSIEATGRTARRARFSCRARSAAPTGHGAAFDPETGMLYVPSMTDPFVADLVPGDPKDTDLRYRARHARAWSPGPQGLPLDQAAVRPDHGDRSEHGGDTLDGAERRRARAITRLLKRSEPAAARPAGARARRS